MTRTLRIPTIDKTAAKTSTRSNIFHGKVKKTNKASNSYTPDSDLLKALVDYADYAGKLDAIRDSPTNPADYCYHGTFDWDEFVTAYRSAVQKDHKLKWFYTPDTEDNLHTLLNFMANDPFMIDIRWMAYILSTASVEAAHPLRQTNPKTGKKTSPWRFMWSPVEEVGSGKGRRYEKPAKVFDLGDGTVRVTEWDGDQWIVRQDGTYKAVNKGAARGVNPAMEAPAQSYTADAGVEHAYYGRGYVQLTWWNNYAAAGVKIGKGISFLTNPGLALDATSSYQLMSYCLRTGFGFANGHKLGDFIYGRKADYKHARSMVNGIDQQDEIQRRALIFEGILLGSEV